MNQITREKYRKFFFISALYNFIASANGMMFFDLMNKLCFGLKTVIPYDGIRFIIRTFYTHVFVFGMGYYIVSRDPEKNRGIVKMGIVAKMSFFFIAIRYYLKKKISLLAFLLAFGDFVFAVLFCGFLMKTSKQDSVGESKQIT